MGNLGQRRQDIGFEFGPVHDEVAGHLELALGAPVIAVLKLGQAAEVGENGQVGEPDSSPLREPVHRVPSFQVDGELASVEPAFRCVGVEFESGFQGIQCALRVPLDVAQGGEDVEGFRLHGVGLNQEINQGGGFGPEFLLDFGELDIGPRDVGLFLHRHLVRGKGDSHVTAGIVRVPLSGQDVGPFEVEPAVFRPGQGLLKSSFGLLLPSKARQDAGALEGGLHHIRKIRFQSDEGLQARLDVAGGHVEPVAVEVPFGVRAPFPFEDVHHLQRSGQVALRGAEVEQSACGEVIFRLVLQNPL